MSEHELNAAKDGSRIFLKELQSRGGFDHWWDDIDPETKKDIIETVESKLESKYLPPPKPEKTVLFILPTGDKITKLPCQSPYLSPFGMGLINITAFRKTDSGEIEVQLADENEKPYNDGTAWALLKSLPNEWPQ